MLDTVNNKKIDFEMASEIASKLMENVSSAIFGQENLIVETLCAFLANGHILMTGAPGLAKTTLVRVFAKNLGLQFGRVQFTPDLLPSDITGSEILNIDPESQVRSFEFASGPIFANLVLADEINRASPRTQSAMLEAMQERTVTVAGRMHRLPKPFMVFATQNPYESEGTFPLPEAQLDRFLIHSIVEYPSKEAEMKILSEHAADSLVGESCFREDEEQRYTIDAQTIDALLKEVNKIRIDEEVLMGINSLVRSTRPNDFYCPEDLKSSIWYGAGPRAGLSLISTSRALALVEGSQYVRWQHIRRMCRPVLRHRIRLTSQAMHQQLDEDYLIGTLLQRVEEQHANLAKGIT
ncbi:MAG: AAA family ATPase [Bdellovibrionota bacterium]